MITTMRNKYQVQHQNFCFIKTLYIVIFWYISKEKTHCNSYSCVTRCLQWTWLTHMIGISASMWKQKGYACWVWVSEYQNITVYKVLMKQKFFCTLGIYNSPFNVVIMGSIILLFRNPEFQIALLTLSTSTSDKRSLLFLISNKEKRKITKSLWN